tara:strand:+ start:167 stop:538 length:372 start_codon:yes stop_codon:yes gene_type:complete
MAINTTWSVNNMTHVDADGGVILAYWSLIAASDEAYDESTDKGGETATEGGKNRFEYDASGSDFISYDALKESDVLGWIWEANKEGDETADEYKARIEAERTAKVQAQIDRKAAQSDGLPWSA